MNHRYVICYPGGSGGSFVASALNSVKNNTTFKIDQQLGHCHNNNNPIPNFYHGDTISSCREELSVIESFDFVKNSISHGHCRNIVAIKETISAQLGYRELEKTTFIKISVNHQNLKEILFVATMLRKKVNCFPELSFDEYLLQTTNYIKSWYWVENEYTIPHTINLSLSNVFVTPVGNMLRLSDEESIKVNQYQVEYLNVQKQLHKETLELLYE